MFVFEISPRVESPQIALRLPRRIHGFALRVIVMCFTALIGAISLHATNRVQQENSLPGTPGWNDFSTVATQDLISGFGSTISVNAGGSIDFYVTTTDPSFTINVFRTGYYQGIGARLVQSLGSFPGLHQAIPTPDPVTGMVACTNWTKTTTLQVPSTWVSGVYLAKLTTSANHSSFIFFVVRDDGGHEDILFQTSVTTYQAYNTWGGTSLYDNQTSKSVYSYPHATKVSFDRPFNPLDSNGAGHYLLYEQYFVFWLEQQGYDVAYTTNVDLDLGSSPLVNHRAFLSVGHDEYWSRPMRTNVENAVASGLNVGFFSANSIYWQIRLEPNPNGVAGRVQVGYKDFAQSPTPPGPDPQWQVNNSILTANWRDPAINDPENALIGVMFESAASGNYIVQNSSNWIYAGSGFVDGTSIPNIVGYEYDKVWNNGFTPAGLTILSQSPVVDGSGLHSNANSTIYTAPSGATVFASGTIQWSWGLANLNSNNFANAGIQRTTANILNNFILGVAEVSFSPSTVNFNGVQVGSTSASQTITLTNSGTGTLNIASIGLTGPDPGDFAQTNNCPAALTSGLSCTINATFTPTAAGTRGATITVTDNAANNPQGVPLSGTGQAVTAPIVSLSPTSLTFASQNVGTSSAPQTITLSNVGTGPLYISSIAIAGTNPGDFSSTNTCPSGTNSLDVNASCTISVTYSPLAGGSRTASLTVTDNAADSPQNASLIGSAIVPTIYFKDGFESGNFNLWNLPSGDSTGTRTVQTQVVNNGTYAASFVNATSKYSYIYTAMSAAHSQTFTRFYFRLASLPQTTPLAIGSAASGSSSWEIDYDSTFQGLDFYFWDSTGNVQSVFSAKSSIVANQWYCVELGVNQTTAGVGQAWLNGALIGTVNANLLTANPFVNLMLYTTSAGTFYFDDVVVSNLYNGPLNAGPSANVSPASVVFANQLVNSTSSSQAVTLSNQGTAALSISNIALGGTNPGDFAQTNNCPSGTNTLAVGASCTINVTFTPSTTGTRGATLAITDNDPTGGQNVPLSGTGAPPTPGATVTPTSLTYASQAVGMTSTAQVITIKSSGTSALSISSIGLGGTNPDDFAQASNCPTGANTLAVGASCTISVTFTPTATGTRSAIVTITDNDPSGVQNVSLSGTGTTPTPGATVTPTSLSYAGQVVGTTSAAKTVTIKSSGTAPLSISSIGLGGTNAGDFAQTNNCPSGTNTLAIGASCTVNVTFTPTATGARSATLVITDNDPSGTQNVALSGSGASQSAGVTVTPTTLAFSSQIVGTSSAAQIITVKSSGTAALSISSITLSGTAAGDYALGNNCPSGTNTLAAGATCTVGVTFTPTARGTRTATVTVSTNAQGTAPTVALSGTGIGPVASLSTTALTFATLRLTTTSAAKSVTLSNKGNSTLNIASIAVTGDFAKTTTCTSTLAAGTSCTVSITFSPTATGTRTGTLAVTDDSVSGSTQTASLTGTGADFTISASPTSAAVAAGGKASYTVTVTALGGNFTWSAAFSCSGLPKGAKCTFSPTSASPGTTSASSALTLSTTSGSTGTPPGTYTINIKGTSSTLVHTIPVTLQVN
ncbi:choice-of-anchor D domain-containing protein [Occallatibacter riparius]|uniref:Choice-of-anchor D domain-containing protein n=1 Tax=Occallatibacter riparius TaxID=1002689 RepID=A0A9J7BPD6_9BACT|nr:choice-of-anchor D domain-containing protein [Occallatibacter riparius]UWZ84576.1 choice-of-anchor D domain-containing protein [Occallatibacter riparius]